MENKDYYIKLKKDVKKLQNKVDNIKLYNARAYVARLLIKSGIILDYAFPFILSSFINSYVHHDNHPYQKNEITEYANIETIDTSNGKHIEHSSFDYEYKKQSLEYSTGWVINDNGLYERDSIVYRLDKKVDTNSIFPLDKDKLEKIATVIDIQNIRKSSLSDSDSIYDKDGYIFTNHNKSETDYRVRKETTDELALDILAFNIEILAFGIVIALIKNKLTKKYVRNKLKQYQENIENLKVTEDNIDELKAILDIKDRNLKMLEGTEKGHSYQLRKR